MDTLRDRRDILEYPTWRIPTNGSIYLLYLIISIENSENSRMKLAKCLFGSIRKQNSQFNQIHGFQEKMFIADFLALCLKFDEK